MAAGLAEDNRAHLPRSLVASPFIRSLPCPFPRRGRGWRGSCRKCRRTLRKTPRRCLPGLPRPIGRSFTARTALRAAWRGNDVLAGKLERGSTAREIVRMRGLARSDYATRSRLDPHALFVADEGVFGPACCLRQPARRRPPYRRRRASRFACCLVPLRQLCHHRPSTGAPAPMSRLKARAVSGVQLPTRRSSALLALPATMALPSQFSPCWR